jgi:hypothetical protein
MISLDMQSQSSYYKKGNVQELQKPENYQWIQIKWKCHVTSLFHTFKYICFDFKKTNSIFVLD